MTLSYRWGDDVSFQTTRSNHEDRKKGFRVEDLPRLFQDAITLTRSLKIKYLWIDSLCILQDDQGDWERQSEQMSQICANSYLTIAAQSHSNPSRSLFDHGEDNSSFEYTLHDGKTVTIEAHQRNPDFTRYDLNSRYIDKQPLGRRGWVFQERVMSRRMVHFCRDLMIFDCKEGLKSEDGTEEPNVEQRSWRSWDHAVSPLYSWYKLVEMYTATTLTYETDKLPALSGIASVFQQQMQDEYVAGLWRKDLISGLRWWRGGSKLGYPQSYAGPSWSWSSVIGPVRFHDMHHFTEIAKPFDLELETKGSNPFGRIEEGAELGLLAPVFKLKIVKDQTHENLVILCLANDESITLLADFDDARIRSSEDLRELDISELRGLVLTEAWLNNDRAEKRYVHQLMLITNDRKDKFWQRRLGVAQLVSEGGEFRDLFDRSGCRTMTWLV